MGDAQFFEINKKFTFQPHTLSERHLKLGYSKNFEIKLQWPLSE